MVVVLLGAVQVAMARSNNIPYVDQEVEQQLNEWIEGLARNDAVSRVRLTETNTKIAIACDDPCVSGTLNACTP
jgi:hypothetical protein